MLSAFTKIAGTTQPQQGAGGRLGKQNQDLHRLIGFSSPFLPSPTGREAALCRPAPSDVCFQPGVSCRVQPARVKHKELWATPKCFSCLGTHGVCRFATTSCVSSTKQRAEGFAPRLSLLEKPSRSVIAVASGQKAGLELSEVPSHLKFPITKALLLYYKKSFCLL